MKKRLLPLFLLLLTLCLLCGCATYSPPSGRIHMYTVNDRGGDWVIDYDAKTISSGAGSYSYTVENAGTADPTVTIILPNGVTYYENNHSSGYTGDYDADKLGGLCKNLMELIRPAYMPQISGPNRVMAIISLVLFAGGIILIILGIFAFIMKRSYTTNGKG